MVGNICHNAGTTATVGYTAGCLAIYPVGWIAVWLTSRRTGWTVSHSAVQPYGCLVGYPDSRLVSWPDGYTDRWSAG